MATAIFNSISKVIHNQITGKDVHTKVCQHMRSNEMHYNGYITFRKDITEKERHYEYIVKVNEISKTGTWNKEIVDLATLAVSNLFQTPISIYSSRLDRSVDNINPGLVCGGPHIPVERINLAHLAIPGF